MYNKINIFKTKLLPKNLYSRLTLITLVTVMTGYAIIYAWTYTDPAPVTSGQALTSNGWNAVVESLFFKRSGASDISFNGGNVGIGTASPGTKLDINGNIHISGDIYTTGWTLLTPSTYYVGNVYYKIIGKHVVFRGSLNSTLNGRVAGWYYLFSNWPAELAAGRGASAILHGFNGGGLIREVYGIIPYNTCTGGSCFQIFKAYTDGDPVTQGEYILFDGFTYELL